MGPESGICYAPGMRSLVVVLLVGACGHPASREECEEIFRRSAEIELREQNVTDPAEISRRTEEARTARGDKLIENCLGKRVTNRAMECVRGAGTAHELDRCLE
jgi:hypothetical protein